jgi:hypothetical protein
MALHLRGQFSIAATVRTSNPIRNSWIGACSSSPSPSSNTESIFIRAEMVTEEINSEGKEKTLKTTTMRNATGPGEYKLNY